jgi:hypothetical protein
MGMMYTMNAADPVEGRVGSKTGAVTVVSRWLLGGAFSSITTAPAERSGIPEKGFGEEMDWKLPTERTCIQPAIRFENE